MRQTTTEASERTAVPSSRERIRARVGRLAVIGGVAAAVPFFFAALAFANVAFQDRSLVLEKWLTVAFLTLLDFWVGWLVVHAGGGLVLLFLARGPNRR